LRQTGFDPGARVELTAALTNAGVLPVKCTRAWVELSRPDRTSAELDLAESRGRPGDVHSKFRRRCAGGRTGTDDENVRCRRLRGKCQIGSNIMAPPLRQVRLPL
jgi:hypothetical protein